MRKLGLREVRLSGGGEPTCHPDFQKIISYLYEHGIALYDLTTNGLLCDKPMIDLLCSGNWGGAVLSLQAFDAKDWVAMTGGLQKDFYRILDNIQYLVEKKRSSPSSSPDLLLICGIDDHTYKKLTRTYDLALDLGVDVLIFTTYNNVPVPRKIISAKGAILNQMREIRSDLASTDNSMRVCYSLNELGLNESLLQDELQDEAHSVPHKDFICMDDYDEPCFMPWYGTTIRANGDVVPCCAALDHAHIGNIHERPITTIWHGKKYKGLRAQFEKILRLKEVDLHLLPGRIACTPFAPPDKGCPVKIYLERLVRYSSR